MGVRIFVPPTVDAPRTRKPVKLPNFLTESQQQTLLAAAEVEIALANTPHRRELAERDLVMLLWGFFTGARLSEMLNQQIEDISFEASTVFIRQGKNCRDRLIPLSPKLAPVVLAWIGERRNGILFPGRRGEPLSHRCVETRYDTLGRKAGLPRRLKPHTTRHTFSVRLLERGVDVYSISHLLGHASLRCTEVYLGCDTSRLKACVEKL